MSNKLVVYENVIYAITPLKIHGKKTTFNLILGQGNGWLFVVYSCEPFAQDPRKHFARGLAKPSVGTGRKP